MTRHYVLWHLQEAAGAIAQTIRDMAADPQYSEPELRVDIGHIYQHLNTAWNARDASEERVETCSESDFHAWRGFPTDIDLAG